MKSQKYQALVSLFVCNYYLGKLKSKFEGNDYSKIQFLYNELCVDMYIFGMFSL